MRIRSRIRVGTLLLCISISAGLGGQINNPEPGFIYDDSLVPRIDVVISATDLALLEANPTGDTEYPVSMSFARGEIVETIDSVGFRYRGNTSRNSLKKSYRLSFDTFDDGRAFYGVEKMNLNAETNDPSMLRSRLSWHMFSYVGLPACRENYVLLYVNGSFYGVYNNTEHIDDKFVRSRFGKNDGNLYKCLWPADLSYKGSSGKDYKFENEGDRVYDLRINEEWDDYQDLARMISVLNQSAGYDFREDFERLFNVQAYLKIMAVDVMTGNWDGYIGNTNNYYLYHDPETGRMEYIPYDLDNTFGIDWVGEDWSERNIYGWNRGTVPLYEKVLEQEVYKKQFTAYVRKLVDYFSSSALEEMVISWQSAIDSWVAQDDYYSLDRGFTIEDFRSALDQGHATETHVLNGILQYAGLRAASALEQIEEGDAYPLIAYARISVYSDSVALAWTVEDDQEGFSTAVQYSLDGGEWQEAAALERGADPPSGIPSYAYTHLVQAEGEYLFRIRASDNLGQITYYPQQGQAVSYPLETGPILINEFMASNDMTISDENGEFDDWLEVYNTAPYPIQLDGVFLSDDASNPGKYRFPDLSLNPGAFYLVWVDSDPEQGDNHTSFKLKKDGEFLRLSAGPSTGYSLMDSLTYSAQETDVAMGRSTDGGDVWSLFSQPTPGRSNLTTDLESLMAASELVLYPNPVSDGVLHFSKPTSGVVYNINGRQELVVQDVQWLNVDMLSPGIYLYRPGNGPVLRFIVSGH